MDNAQLAGIISAIAAGGAAIATAIRYVGRRVVKSQDAATAALIANASAYAQLAAQVSAMHASIDRVVDILLGIPAPRASEESRRRKRVHTTPHGSPVAPPPDDDSGDYGG